MPAPVPLRPSLQATPRLISDARLWSLHLQHLKPPPHASGPSLEGFGACPPAPRQKGSSQGTHGSRSASLSAPLVTFPEDAAPTGAGPPGKRYKSVWLILPGTSTFYSHSSNQQGQGRASLLVPSLPRQTALRTAAGTVQGQSKQLGCCAGDTERGHGPTTLP